MISLALKVWQPKQINLTTTRMNYGNLPLKVRPLDTVQDFLIKLGIKPRMHLLEISLFSIYHDIVRPTKIMNMADKNRAHF